MRESSGTNKELLKENALLKKRIQELEISEVELRRVSEEKFQMLLSESPDPTFSFSPEGHYRYVNKAFADGVGKPVEEIIGKSIWDVFPKEEADKRFAALNQVFRTGEKKVIEVRVPGTDGDRYYITTISPIKDSNGKIISALCSSKDITDRKQVERALKESEAKFAESFLKSPIPMSITAMKEGRYIEVNEAFAKVMGLQREELIDNTSISVGFIAAEQREIFLDEYRQKGFVENLELQMHVKGGELRCGLFNSAIITIGEEDFFLTQMTDITEAKHAEEALRESETKFRTLFESANDAIFLMDKNIFIECNSKTLEMFGCNKDQIIGQSPYRFSPEFQPDGRRSMEKALEKIEAALNGHAQLFEWKHSRLDGTLFDAEICLNTLDTTGNSCLQAIVRDVTERKRMEDALRENEAMLSSVFKATPVGLCIMKDRVFQSANKAWYEIFGYSESEIIGHTTRVLYLNEEEYERVGRELYANLLKSGLASVQTQLRRKDGVFRDAVLTAAPLQSGNISFGTVVVIEDTTDRRQVEEELKDSRKQLENIIEFLPDATLVIDGDSKVIAWNRAMESMTGIRKEDMLGKGDYEYALPFYGERRPILIDLALRPDTEMEKQYTTMQRIGDILFGESYTPKLPPGDIFLSATASILRDSRGKIIAAIEVIRDNTERKRMEDTLLENEEKYRLIFKYSPLGLLSFNEKGIILACNDYFVRIIGSSQEALVGLNILNLPDKVMVAAIQKALNGSTGLYQGLYHSLTAAKITPMRALYAPIDVGDRHIRGGVGIVEDITEHYQAEEEKRILEERLNRAEKMEALGQLAGGVAHDLNNVLGILSGYSELLLMDIPEGHKARGHVEKILLSTEKGAAIIQDLLTLARRGVTSTDVINLNDVVSCFLKTLAFEKMKDYHPRVTVVTKCQEELLNIKGSSIHLEKTLMNLMSNAMESIHGRGEVTIRTESRYLDKPIRGYDEIKEGDYTILTVSDTGMGIPAEHREKIFEPFFTKKIMGRSGTGLGLAIVWGTVKDHSGYIDVQSEVGEGTTFTLFFPVTREELTAQQQKVALEQYMGNGESVLIVDDIAEQRDIASGLLRKLGYEVQTVFSGEEAIKYLRGNKADILVLDMIMAPGIDGLETYQMVLEINPKQKAILVSGFSETDRVLEAQRLGAGAYVKKPYVLEKIGLAIRDELKR